MSEFTEDGRGRPPIWPFSRMEVGDTVLIPTTDYRQIGRRVSDHKPKRFKCRRVMRDGMTAMRVERIA